MPTRSIRTLAAELSLTSFHIEGFAWSARFCGLENFDRLGTFPVPWLRELAKRMSLVVKLEDDLGERGDWVMLHSVIPSRDEKEYPLLSGIDPYGKTVFNHLQMERFLEEWGRVRDRAKDDSQQEAWKRVQEMALACKDDRDLYLRFVGN